MENQNVRSDLIQTYDYPSPTLKPFKLLINFKLPRFEEELGG
jgi:hypothetical protein